ncbi:MAG: ABC transporter ATP-binding protein [bacterium]
MNNSGPLLKMEGIRKSYPMGTGEVEVLRDVHLMLPPGGMLSIVGVSGAGKSTLLHIIGALDRPTEGYYYYRDKNVFSYSERKLARFRNKTIGFVFQFHHLLPEFTALENTMIPLMISGKGTRKENANKARGLLAEVGLEERKAHKPSELSGGEQQRVAIARALANDPELLLADEPTGNLDTRTSQTIFDLMVKLNKQRGMSTIIVTHNMELAKRTDCRLRLQDGKILD